MFYSQGHSIACMLVEAAVRRAAAGAAQHFAHGMCKVCYEEFLEVTGGTSAGADPPAFTAGLAPKKVALMHCPVHTAMLPNVRMFCCGCQCPGLIWLSWLQRKRRNQEEDLPALPGLEQEEEEQDIEMQLEAVLQQDGMGKYTRVRSARCHFAKMPQSALLSISGPTSR